jgi:hypothetical protein
MDIRSALQSADDGSVVYRHGTEAQGKPFEV